MEELLHLPIEKEKAALEALKAAFAELRDLAREERGLLREFLLCVGGVGGILRLLGVEKSLLTPAIVFLVSSYYITRLLEVEARRENMEMLIRRVAGSNPEAMVRPTKRVIVIDIVFMALFAALMILALYMAP